MERPSQAAAADAAAVTRTAGRGYLYITIAKLFFIAAGYAVHFLLPRLLAGDPAQSKHLYGLYGVVASLVNVLNMMVIQGALQAVSKLVSEDETRAPDVRRAALKVQAVVGAFLAIGLLASADLIADAYNDPGLARYYRLCSAVVFSYGFYAVFIGVLNGRKQFRNQALFDMSYATLKTGCIVVAAALGFSLTGVFGGFAAAAVLVFVAAAFVVGIRGGVSSRAIERRLLAFMLPVMLYTLTLNLLLTVDLWILKAELGTAGLAAGQSGLLAAIGGGGGGVADYTAAQVISRIPYQATLSITFVIFPLVSRATFDGDQEKASGYVRTTLRYSLILLTGLVVVIAAPAAEVIAVPYPKSFVTAAPALRVLSVGMLLFALFAILGAIITSSGRAKLALALAAGTLGVDVLLCYLLIPRYGAVGAAAATTGALFLGVVAALVTCWRLFRAGIGLLSPLRIGAASAAAVGVSLLFHSSSRLITIVKCGALAAVYFAVLVVTRELGRTDWERVRAVFSRGAKKGVKEVP